MSLWNKAGQQHQKSYKGERADTKIRDEVFICDPGNDASNVEPILAPEWQNYRCPESGRRQNSANIQLRSGCSESSEIIYGADTMQTNRINPASAFTNTILPGDYCISIMSSLPANSIPGR
jgi:hypothetical protein